MDSCFNGFQNYECFVALKHPKCLYLQGSTELNSFRALTSVPGFLCRWEPCPPPPPGALMWRALKWPPSRIDGFFSLVGSSERSAGLRCGPSRRALG